MKQIPILFTTPMVQAILEGRKTKTRRVNGLELINDDPDWYIWLNEYPQAEIPRLARPYDDRYYYAFTGKNSNRVLTVTHCPYGKPGDLLWVRESHFRFGIWIEDEGEFTKSGKQAYKFIPTTDDVRYFDNPPETYGNKRWKKDTVAKWYRRPSIHMPKEACRIFLRVKSVRVERLQDISDQDAIAEGIESIGSDLNFGGVTYPGEWYTNYQLSGYSFLRPKESFKSLWQSIYGTDSWEFNPWVWVIEFSRLNDHNTINNLKTNE